MSATFPMQADQLAAALSQQILPELRQELSVYDGPTDGTGAPTWTLHDPVRNLYFKLDWPTFEILSRWSCRDGRRILKDIAEQTTLHLEQADIDRVRDFVIGSELVVVDQSQQISRLAQAREKRNLHWFKQLLHLYLFFRVPLVKPDNWLDQHLDKFRWLGSRWFTQLTLAVAALGVFEISRQWQTYSGTLVDMLNPSGMVFFGITLALVKVAHEMGHALVAKTYGCRVPRMGVAFLVFFPVAYTDVNDAWKLQDRKARLHIDAAGIRVELALAAWFSLLWSVLPEGHLKSAAYMVSSTTWISTLLVNASPFMRFDGYFIFMDALNLPNLHQRSFAFGKWLMATRLIGFKQEKPEHLKPTTEHFLTGFAFATWLYRLVLFVGIAWMVYTTIPKPLGPVLAWIELYWFIIKPAYTQCKVWWQQWLKTREEGETLNHKKRLPVLLAIAVGLLVMPWDSSIQVEGLIKPKVVKKYVLPDNARLVELAEESQRRPVQANELLARFESETLLFENEQDNSRLKQIEHQIQEVVLSGKDNEKLSLLIAEKNELLTHQETVDRKSGNFNWTAEKAGYFYLLDADLRNGDWVGKNTQVAVLFDASSPELFAYLDAARLARLKVGDTGRFYPDMAGLSPFKVTVTDINKDSLPILDEPILASDMGGRISARNTGRAHIPEQVLYKVILKAEDLPENWRPDLKITGRVTLSGESESYLSRYFRSAAAFVQRESGL